MAYKRTSAMPVVEGGTGQSTLTVHGVVLGNTTSGVNVTTAGTNGQLLIGSTGADPQFSTVTSALSTIGFTAGAHTLALDVNAGFQTVSGWATFTGSGAYFDDTTLGTFQLLRGGTGYINGTPVSFAAQNITGLTAGNTYYIYIDSSGTIQKTATYSDSLFQNNIVLFECLRDSTPVTNNQITVRENHPYNFQPAVSTYCHEVIGCVIENNNNGANITLNGTQKIQINGADVLQDHGLETVIPDSSGVGVTWRKMYTDGSGKWATQNNTDTFTGYYNNAGTPTALSANRFGVYTLYVSKDNLNSSTPTYLAVLNTSQYTTQNNADNAIANGTVSKASNELLQLELAQLGYIVYSQATNAIIEVIISKATLKRTLSTGGTNIAALINTNTTNFNNVLSATDTTVQAALDTIDDFGSGTGTQTVHLYDGAGVKTVTLGSTNTTSATTVQSGSTGITITSATANGPISIVSGTGTIGIATSATNSTINVGTGAGVKTTTLGSTNTTSTTTVNFGTGGYFLASATGNVMTALSSGECNYPLQPAFLAVLATTVTDVTGDGTNYTIVFDTEIFDQNADFDGSSTFTAPVTGRYMLDGGITFADIFSSVTNCLLRFETSNRVYMCGRMNPTSAFVTGGYVGLQGNVLADMDSGDTAVLIANAGSTTKTIDVYAVSSTNVYTYFSGYLAC